MSDSMTVTDEPILQRDGPPDPGVFKCRHCGWKTAKWRTSKAGKRVSGWKKLQDHLQDAHDIDVDLIGNGSDA